MATTQSLENKIREYDRFVKEVASETRMKSMRGEAFDRSRMAKAISIYVNVLSPWNEGVDGGIPLKDSIKEFEANRLNKLLDVYLPAIMASLGDDSRSEVASREALGDLQNLLVEQGLDESEGIGTLGGLLSQQPLK